MPKSSSSRRVRMSRKSRARPSIKNVVRQEIKKQSVSEIKQLDTVPNATYSVSYDVPVSYPLSLCAQGDTQGQREGREIGVKSIDLYVTGFRNSSNTTGSHDRMAVALVRTKRSIAGTGINWGDVFAYNGTTHNSVYPFRDVDVSDEYQVLKTWSFDLGDSTGNPKTTKQIHWKRSYKVPQKVTYIGTNATEADAGTGHYYLIATSDVISSGYPPTIQYGCRLEFYP